MFTNEVKNLLEQAQDIEKNWNRSAFPRVDRLKNLIDSLQQLICQYPEESQHLEKLFRRLKLSPGALGFRFSQLRDFLPLVVAIERELDKGVADQDLFHQFPDQLFKPIDLRPQYLILHNLRSAFNVGSLLRTALCFGFKKVYLTGYTPEASHLQVKKSALGADELISWEWRSSALDLISELQATNIPVFAMETSVGAKNIFSQKIPRQFALILGNERFGLEQSVLKSVNKILSIPMQGAKNSLNVAVCFGSFCGIMEAQRYGILQNRDLSL